MARVTAKNDPEKEAVLDVCVRGFEEVQKKQKGNPATTSVLDYIGKVRRLKKDKPAFAVVRKNKSPDNWAVPFNNKKFECSAPQKDFETRPECTGVKGTNDCVDATLEEVWHIIQGQGYAPAFKKYFWMGDPGLDMATKFKNVNSTLATLTDAARGQIPRVPSVPKGGKFPATV